MTAYRDITGERFGFLEAIRVAEHGPKIKTRFIFRCVCGVEKSILVSDVRGGKSKSCGCKKGTLIKLANPNAWQCLKTHGLSRTRLKRVWQNMVDRCTNPRNRRFKDYGGRGITVCKEWMDLATFGSWAKRNGYDDALQIDRIDNDSGYRPDNCRFVTPKQNMANRRNSPKAQVNAARGE